jgi:hypothetical protein
MGEIGLNIAGTTGSALKLALQLEDKSGRMSISRFKVECLGTLM